MTDSLAARLTRAPRLADPERAKARLDDLLAAGPDLAPVFEAARDLLLGLADHSPFLWGLAARDPARLAGLLERAPEESNAAILASTCAFNVLRNDVENCHMM